MADLRLMESRVSNPGIESPETTHDKISENAAHRLFEDSYDQKPGVSQDKPKTYLEKRVEENQRIWKEYAEKEVERDKEDYKAFDQVRDNLQKPFDPLLRTAFKFSEVCSDEVAHFNNTVRNIFFNDNAHAKRHCEQLEQEIRQATREDNPHAANHFAKREVEFAVRSLKIDHPVTQDLIRRYGLANNSAKPERVDNACSTTKSVLRLSRIPASSAMRYESAR